MNPPKRHKQSQRFVAACIALFCGLSPVSLQAAGLSITRAEWSSGDGGRLYVEGSGTASRTVTIKNAASGSILGTSTVEDRSSWRNTIERPSPVPCRVRVEQSGGGAVERDVAKRPANCGPVASTPSLRINDVTVTEGGIATFTVSLSAASSKSISVRASTANGSAVAPGDFTARSNVTLTFPAGSTSQSFAVTTINDTAVETTETFNINLSAAVNATIADPQGVGNITDNDSAPDPMLSINNVTVTEGGTANFTVSLSPASSRVVSVVVSTANGSAVAPGDYTARTNVTLTFPVGNTSQGFVVSTINDTVAEATETFNVNLVAASNAGIAVAQGVGTITDNDKPLTRPNVSINSTSQNRTSIPGTTVLQQSRTSTPGFQVLAVNDLGMHCGDLDTRIMSILPPFNVMHAQVVRKGSTGAGKPTRLGADQVTVRYSAASNPQDPILINADSILDPGFDGIYKTNFWDVARAAYDPFYPGGVLPLFYPAGDDILDLGLPAPDLERLYLGDGQLAADQQAMPGRLFPYSATDGNMPQYFSQFVGTQPFFVDFPFGYTAPVNWFEAAGVPITSFDDYGRENAYPLMRVQAVANSGNTLGVAAGTVLASLDTVVPVSGEADCKACHAATMDGGNGSAVARLSGKAASSIDDPQFGSVPVPVSVEWATDKNILKLHDTRHATKLITGTTEDFPTMGATPFKAVVCQTCHYTPALDLAHVGPNDVNGRQQSKLKSMSAVMHASHANVLGTDGQRLFPEMPGPVNRDPFMAHQVLENTCYQCHPGKRTQCLRGAMGQAGSVCQDCHGNMAQVGDDFSRKQPNGGFEVLPDFYTNSKTPRVPWANQPGCGSCHTGDAFSNIPATGVYKAPDNIRLLQAWRIGDSRAAPIVPTNKRFAENVVTTAENPAAAGNPKLYRVSTGHGGLTCEACHGSTHAEWSSNPAKPNANDNLAATQLQGHPGAVIECGTCHTAYTGTNLNGPHGMHPVANGTWIDHHHEVAETTAQKNACRACHGMTGQGTPLSRTPVARTMDGRSFAKGEAVTCTKCHENELR